MYSPYVPNKFPSRDHNASVLDIEIIHGDLRARMPRGWWIPTAVIAACGLAGWIATIPLSLT